MKYFYKVKKTAVNLNVVYPPWLLRKVLPIAPPVKKKFSVHELPV